MLRISKLTDYALLIMTQLAKEPFSIISAAMLAEILHLGAPTVSKILKMLSEKDLVHSIRGAEGGYRLARSAKEITVAEILVAMEGNLSITECCEHPGACTVESLCLLRKNWMKINKVFKNFLTQVTLLDMLQPLSLKGSLHV